MLFVGRSLLLMCGGHWFVAVVVVFFCLFVFCCVLFVVCGLVVCFLWVACGV